MMDAIELVVAAEADAVVESHLTDTSPQIGTGADALVGDGLDIVVASGHHPELEHTQLAAGLDHLMQRG